MDYCIYFDESNKLDQPDGKHSFYGALGATKSTIDKIVQEIEQMKQNLNSDSELHFVDYRSDQEFEKYFRILNFVLEQDLKINLMMVNKKGAEQIAQKMSVTLLELRELFYVKIPERLFYGMTRRLKEGQSVQIVIDENSEYKKIELEAKLEEQMNAHSAYRNKGYKVEEIKQVSSDANVALQLIDVLMGMVVFLLEKHYQRERSVTTLIKEDLIYRILIQDNNLKKMHEKITVFEWRGEGEEINVVPLSEYTGQFLMNKTHFDIQEMNKLAKIKLIEPDKTTKYFRQKMGYTNGQVRMIQGYLSELKGDGRNSYYLK